jgi:hypothetical protein
MRQTQMRPLRRTSKFDFEFRYSIVNESSKMAEHDVYNTIDIIIFL